MPKTGDLMVNSWNLKVKKFVPEKLSLFLLTLILTYDNENFLLPHHFQNACIIFGEDCSESRNAGAGVFSLTDFKLVQCIELLF